MYTKENCGKMSSTKEDVCSNQDISDGDYSLAQSRSRRQKVDKKGRLSAFEKLRQAKERGIKNKYEVEEEKNVYEVVDETEYSELVKQRQEDDWIIDDDGAGYVEDGREIFDDEMDDDSSASTSRKKKQEQKKNKNIVRPGTKPKQDIKTMFAAAASSAKHKPEKDVSLANDDMLDDILKELDTKKSSTELRVVSAKEKVPKRPAHNPFKVESKQAQPERATKHIKRELSFPVEESQSAKVTRVAELAPVKKELEETPDTSPVLDDLTDVKNEPDLSGIDFDVDITESETDVKPKLSETLEEMKPKCSEEMFALGWQHTEQDESPTDLLVDTTHLPLVKNSADEPVLQFYWLDAFEDPYHQPGTVYLFGKVHLEKAKAYVSCCVAVKNIERRIFILPRPKRVNVKTNLETSEDVTMPMVFEEFNTLTEKYKIDKFRSARVKKNYAFEKLDVPVEADYLEVRYLAEFPALPSELKGETFSHVFGTNTSSLELLLLNQKMKGPAWLDLKQPQIQTVSTSWCKLEALITKPENVIVSDANIPPPPLVLMTLNMRTLLNPKTRQNEIIAVSCLIHKEFYMDRPAPKENFQQHFCVISKPADLIYPFDFRDQVKKMAKKMKVDIMPAERGLLGYLLAKIHAFDPDLIVGHDIFGFDIDLLLHRISANKIPHWSKISRLKRTSMPKLTQNHSRVTFAEKAAVCGRLMCDIQISAKELIRCRSYDLTELASQIIKTKREEVDSDHIREMFSSSPKLLKLIELSLLDSLYILQIMYELNAMPLALQITNICGNILSRTLLGGRSERNEWLLLHAFHKKQYICPDKEYKKKQVAPIAEEEEDVDQVLSKKAANGKRKPAYSGGLVLEPKKGFYDTFILLLDFNSLYPSIIQEYNICFTTISRSVEGSTQNEAEDDMLANIVLPSSDLEPGVLPTEIRKLVDSRRQVKALMKGDLTAEQMMQYDIRQKALKLTANSMYGCLGFTFSRFYAKPLAALVTSKGREILLKTKDLVQSLNLDVIYGDTDSIMINTNITDFDQVYKIGNKVKNEVNKLYRLLEIDIDGVFKSMLLLKKKKYAALSITKGPDGQIVTHQEMKGLDIVRRDWCVLAKEAGQYVISQIFSGESRETVVDKIHSYLQDIGDKVRSGEVLLESFYITKQLTKNPEDYPDSKSLPHVQVAMRYNTKSGKKLKAGDTVPYIICEDGSTMSATQRAYHPDELAKNENLKIDVKYYLAHQIHPVVARLCDPIEGTDSAHIAQCLGLDPSGYRPTTRQEEVEEDLVTLQLTMEEKFRDCERLKFPCPSVKCSRSIVLDSPFTGNDSSLAAALLCCPNTDCRTPLWKSKNQIKNLLQLKIQQHVNKYYQGWLKCEDTGCATRTNRLPLIMQRGHPVCPACDKGYLCLEYTDTALYNQLCFYDYMFDVQKAASYLNETEKAIIRKMNPELLETYRELKHLTSRWLDKSTYSNVDLGKLFQGLGLSRIKTEREI
ncbi:DNA polymerase alpha catalytic subunit [Biomphalaria pfeifferi]|uniref:DNA polymerase n=1 Tax=Biomphalaria pfeifferi TaxID=112525 RepID=A0AAD8BUE7_BIOPF|nr:DNA polymerase alpha catalytic subunit [Biomphalaria pfeifferi]